MIKVNNKKMINKLAFKNMTSAKSRNIMAILAIVLTTVLFTCLLTVSIGVKDSFQYQTIRQAGGDGHGALKYINDEQYNNIKNHKLINKISYNKIVADSVDSTEFLKRHVEMYYMDDVAMELGFCEPTAGSKPIKENEIITDTKTLDLLGVPHKIGANVPLEYTVRGEKIKRTFKLSGYWESDPVFNVGLAIVSRAYVDAMGDKLKYTYNDDYSMVGAINSYVMFDNSFNLEDKLTTTITESGYTIPEAKNGGKFLDTDIRNNINWAYISSSFSLDPTTIISFSLLVLLIIFSGYLIIYNIFQISVIRDIKFYGLLKIIGTTSKQIRRIISFQAIILCLIGIPIGLLVGFIIGCKVMPMVLSITNYDLSDIKISYNPAIFIASSIFALITVFISTRKPARIASKSSPVEAVKYSGGNENIKNKTKRTKGKNNIRKMALSNISRNKKRTIIAIVSMTLSLVILNSVFTITNGIDMDKFLAKFVDTDFLIGHANYFNQHRFRSAEDELNATFISAVKSRDEFKVGGKIYYNIDIGDCSIYRENPNEKGCHGYQLNLARDGQPMLDLYGMDDFNLSRLDIIEGSMDIDRFKEGQYIIEGVHDDDHGNIINETSHYEIGDKVKITVDGNAYEYEVMAKIRINSRTISSRFYNDFAFYLPSDKYKSIVKKPVLMTYAFDVIDGTENEMESFLKSYTNKIQTLMDYESKAVFVNEFDGVYNLFLTVGGILSAIIGLIGVLNFVNSMFTSIWSRRREFAMLQGIGMSRKQLISMLSFEGLYYALFTIFASIVLSTVFSKFVIDEIVSNLWFFSYRFVIMPLLIVAPILILVSVIIPYVAYISIGKDSIVERLRIAE
ncbi:FtsX-like permease family protein [Clostridiaceae bacterium M8S5]|nr:FtsX-like permease family protein [Clostridiaceae bacterium M8S5]